MKIHDETETLVGDGVKRENHMLTFLHGVRTGIPVAVGYVPIAIAFGAMAKSAGIPDYVSVMMSLMVYAGASQFVGVNLLSVGAAYWEIVVTTFVLNLRHFLMSASLSQRIPKGASRIGLALVSFGLTDETFSLASVRQEPQLRPAFLAGLNLIAFAAWNAGTWIGVFLSASLPATIQAGMGIALYAMFIGLLVPSLKKSRAIVAISLLAAGMHAVLRWVPPFSGLSAGLDILIVTVAAAAAGALLFPKEEEPS